MTASAGKQIKAEAAWYRSEHERIDRQLAAMTPGHAEAIGAAAVRRMHADHETFLQLAEEHESHLATYYPDLVDQVADDAPALF